MASKTIQIAIQTTLDAKGAREAQQWLDKLAQAQTKATPKSQGDPFAPVGAGAQKATTSVVALQRAQAGLEAQSARLARAQGDTARAAQLEAQAQQTLTAALVRTDTTTLQSIATQRQLISVQQQVTKANQQGATMASQFGDAMKSSLLGIVGPAAAATVALQSVGATVELTRLGAQADQTRQRFDGLARAAGTTGDALLQALRSASGGTISDLNLQLAANRAQLLGVADSAQEFSVLMEIARARAQDMGISTTQAFNDLITGLGRGSALILDNLGITVSVAEANKVYAAQLGKTASALTEVEQKQALINAVLAQGKASLDTAGGAAETNASKIERFQASIENAKTSVGGLFALQAGPFLDELTKVTDALTGIGSVTGGVEGLAKALAQLSDIGNLGPIGQLQDLGESLGLLDVSQQIEGTTATWGAFIGALQEGKSVTDALSAAGQASTAVLSGQATSAQQAAGGITAVSSASQQATANVIQLAVAQAAETQAAYDAAVAASVQTQAQIAAAEAHRMGEHEARSFSVATGDAMAASLADAAAKDEQTARTQLLQAQTMAAADAFLALHPNISASGIASMAAAGQINPLIAQLALAAIRAREATAELARFNTMQGLRAQTARQLVGADSPEAEARNFQRNVRVSDLKQRATDARAAEAAERNYQRTLGNYGPSLAQAKAELAQLTKGTAAYINKENEIAQLQQQQASAAKRGAGGAGGAGRAAGAVKLSDQQKLNNQLLTNEEKFQNQMQDAEEAHYKKLLDIEKDYQEKSLAQQQKNELSKRESELDFLKSITESELNATEEGREEIARINERFYADFEAAQKAAQEGNAEQSEKMVDQARKRADVELEYAQQIDEARRKKNKDEVKRLEALREKERQLLDEQDKQVREGGDANVKARDEAIAQENERYTDQTEHIKEQAGRAADAKISAAERAGKAVDAENSSLQRQLELLEKIKTKANELPATGGAGVGAEGGATGEGSAPPAEGPATGGGASMRARGMASMRVGGSGGGMQSSNNSDDALATLRMAIQIIGEIERSVVTNKKMMGALQFFRNTVQGTIDIFTAIADLRAHLQRPQAPISIAAVQQLADDTATITSITTNSIVPVVVAWNKHLERYKAATDSAVGILKAVMEFREELAGMQSPLDVNMIVRLAAEAATVVNVLFSQLIPVSENQNDALKRYQEAQGASVTILRDMADLARNMGAPIPPIPLGIFEKLAGLAALALHIVSTRLVPVSQAQAEELKRYQEAAAASIAILKDMGDLVRSVKEPLPPVPRGAFERLAGLAALATHIILTRTIPQTQEQTDALKRYQESNGAALAVLKDINDLVRSVAQILPPVPLGAFERLADMAAQATRVVVARAVPASEEQAAALKRYQETQGAAVSVLKDTAELGKALTIPSPAVSAAAVTRLADEAKRITQIVLSRMVPASDEQAEAAKRYAETTGAAIETLKSTLELPAKLFTDYQSPTNAQIDRVVADANRIVQRVNAAAKVYDTKGLEAAKAFGEATGSILSSFREQLLFAQALNSGDFVVDPKNLSLFEQGMARTLAVAGRLGAQAAAIPAGNIAALQNATAALTSSYESMIKLSAVPFGNIPAMTGGMGGGGGGANYTFNNTFMLPPGTTQQMGQQILGTLRQQLMTRR